MLSVAQYWPLGLEKYCHDLAICQTKWLGKPTAIHSPLFPAEVMSILTTMQMITLQFVFWKLLEVIVQLAS